MTHRWRQEEIRSFGNLIKFVIFVKIEISLLLKTKLLTKIVCTDDFLFNLTSKISLKNIWSFGKVKNIKNIEKPSKNPRNFRLKILNIIF